jgi:vacuolar protein sorting-associated protein 13A/C
MKNIVKINIEKDEDEDNKPDKKKDDTFAERIQIQIVRNLELQIKNIHIRYEDDFSKPDHPFSAGVTLNSIEIKVI